MPQSNPNSNQGRRPSRSSRVRASQISVANRSADRLVSHTERVHQNMTLGNKAQAQADPTATFSENMRRATRKIGTQVSAEKKLFSVSRTNAAALE